MTRRYDDDDYDDDDDRPAKPRKKRKKALPPISIPMRPVVWAIVGLLCCWMGPITGYIGWMAYNSAQEAENELPESSRADTARQMMSFCKIAGIVEVCLGVLGGIVGIILTVKGKPS
jgi:hypothetical protein